MAVAVLEQIANLITRNRESLLVDWRELVCQLPSAVDLDMPTLNDHIPNLLDELAEAFMSRSNETIPDALKDGTPPAHGLQRVKDGFNVEEVVAEYNILRGCIHDLVERNGLTLAGAPFHVLNRVFDSAIGLAVQTFVGQKALEAQNRREDYLSFVAHDLRTPLSAISLSARVLQEKYPQDAAADPLSKQLFRSLHRNIGHLEDLVRKIIEENENLETEIGVKLERRTFDLWPLVESLTHDLHPVANTGTTRLINQVPADMTVYADASLLKRVFQNLIANAIRYTPAGQVVIGAGPSGDSGAVVCWVADSGEGIPAELLDKVFKKGETDAQDGGMGLGLAIVKAFTEAHGGTVTVESTPEEGTTFRFTLPAKI